MRWLRLLQRSPRRCSFLPVRTTGPRSTTGSDFASDTSIRKEGQDPATGTRYLDEIAFEIVNEQPASVTRTKAEDLTRRGVRRVFGIFVKTREVKEWSDRTREWKPLRDRSVICDARCLRCPLPVKALLDAAEADIAVVTGVLGKDNPEIARAAVTTALAKQDPEIDNAVASILVERAVMVPHRTWGYAAPEKRRRVVMSSRGVRFIAIIAISGSVTGCGPESEMCGGSGDDNCCASALVTGGTYNRSNDPRYPATVSDFVLDGCEITVGRFRKFVEGYPANKPAAGAGAHPRIAGSGWDPAWDTDLPDDQAVLKAGVKCSPKFQTWTDSPGANENLPMNCISWRVAFAFCAWDGGRLPTDAEWNYAAAGGDQQREYPWGSAVPSPSHAVFDCSGDGSQARKCAFADIRPVGSKSPMGNGRWGQTDLAGSMWEWNLDSYEDGYTSTMQCDDCANIASGSFRVYRGGSWGNDASDMRSSPRYGISPQEPNADLGARCARTQ